MQHRKIFQILVLMAVVVSAFGFAGGASAWYCDAYVTVQWGDTLSGIASLCGTTVDTIRAANPGLGWWVYAGQVLYIPTGSTPAYSPSSYGGTYVVQWGDTLAKISGYYGVTVNDMLSANPQVWSPSLIYAGQVLNIPAVPAYHTVVYGETLRIIAGYYGTTVYNLQLLNPTIYDPNYIYPGQSIRIR